MKVAKTISKFRVVAELKASADQVGFENLYRLDYFALNCLVSKWRIPESILQGPE